jgi:RNA polymerase sigma factor (sigma-70 family)
VIEESIILRAQRGDSQAFQQIVEEYHGITWRTARVLLGNSALTEDVLQEAWIDVWRGLPRLQNRQTIRSWLLTVIANRCRMALRRSAPAVVSLESEQDVLLMPDEVEDILEQITRQETYADIRTALAALPADQRRVLELRYFADLELSEIALVASLPLGTVKSRQHRALHTLRTIFQAEQSALIKKEKVYHEHH